MSASILKDLLGTVDNSAFELGRVLWAIGVLALLGFQGFALWKGQTFSPTEFGLGFAGILAAGGGGIAMKDAARAKTIEAKKDTAE